MLLEKKKKGEARKKEEAENVSEWDVWFIQACEIQKPRLLVKLKIVTLFPSSQKWRNHFHPHFTFVEESWEHTFTRYLGLVLELENAVDKFFYTSVPHTLFVSDVQGLGSMDKSTSWKQMLQKAAIESSLLRAAPSSKRVSGCLSVFRAKEKVGSGLSQEVT